MVIIANYKDCGTAGLRALDLQLIRQVQRIAPDALVSFAHLPVNLGSGCHAYLQASAMRALELAIESRAGHRMTVNSAYRTLAQQTVLYNHCQHRRCGITAAAVPGKSNHNTGLAIDVEDPMGWKGHLEKHSWDWIGAFDRVHYDYKDGRSKDLRFLSVKAFQQLWNFNFPHKKILEDGEWGTKTHQCLLSTSIEGFLKIPSGVKSLRTEKDALPNAQSLVVPSIPSLFPSLREGSKGDSVKKLQQALVKRGVILDVDGDFGESTLRGVKAFQLKAGLDPDGVVGLGTAKALGLS